MTTAVTEDLRRAIEAWMVAKKLTLKEAGDILGCSHMAVHKLVNGDTKNVRAKMMKALEPHINKYRNPAELQNEYKDLTAGLDDSAFSLCNFESSILDHLKSYKERNNYSFDDLGKKHNLPISKLAKWFEIDASSGSFNISPSDFSEFAAFVSQVFSEDVNEKKTDIN